ncbi:serine protease inhibitor Kazal-type 2 [Prinia subflava]|uniref:serine protease inhibitor Kazal-type 2 n=1 Tax=Prinia subflava TaxID=208062 RepID=UPI002FE0393A
MARPRAVLLLLLPVLLAGLFSCPGAMASYPPNCAQYKYMCPRDYHPVCGTDGETYGNECVLCLANREDHTNIEIAREGHC